VALVALALAACAVPGAEGLFFSSRTVAEPAAADCERCHQEVYREWRASAHALAFTSESFRAASADARASACAGCHAPAPVDAEAPVALRSAHLDEGVTCLSCHLSTRPGAAPLTMRGPASRTSPVEIHPIVEEDPLYRSSELCGRCHEAELAQWRAAPEPADGGPKATCQECHMPEVRRKVESVHDEHAYSALFVALGRAQDLRRHEFAVPERSDEWLALGVQPGVGALRVRVRNGVPHALPTGAFGRRQVRVALRWPGGRAERVLAEAVPAGGERELRFPLPAGVRAADVQASLERWDRPSHARTALAR
jgi:hypothetical protein